MWILLALTAALATPEAIVTDGGAVVGTAHIQTTPDVFLGLLEDPRWVAKVYDGGTEITDGEKRGACQVFHFMSPSAIMKVHYSVLRCPKPDGVEATLITSDAFSAYTTRWTAKAAGDGTDITYMVDATSSLMVPQSFVRSSIKTSVKRMMQRMEEYFAQPR